MKSTSTRKSRRKLIIVSWRLPHTITFRKGELLVSESPGGLASALASFLPHLGQASKEIDEYVWVGCPGIAVSPARERKVRARLTRDYRAVPVFLSAQDINAFYNGFCNRTLWPLFHYFPSYTVLSDEYWKAYEHVQRAFCKTVADLANPNDLIWVHDFQLMLLPHMLRQKLPRNAIGFFLHIPFPSFEVFQILPNSWRIALIKGMLGADIVGFHTHDYAKYFLKSALRTLGYEHELGMLEVDGRKVKVDNFPLGIDFDKFAAAGDKLSVQRAFRDLEMLDRLRVIASIDRLDYTKGILNRLKGYHQFLETHPAWRGKVVLILVVVPSRVKVDQYHAMKRELDELVGNINGAYGTLHWTPIRYQYAQLAFPALTALYQRSDVALVTPLRDGMNLVAKEYLACHAGRTGVLILSEMTGSAKELGEAVIVNPYHVGNIADALERALLMPKREQIRRNDMMIRRLQRYDVVAWGKDFITTLLSTRQRRTVQVHPFSASIRSAMIEQWKRSRRRLIFFDYDGTVTPIVASPPLAAPNGHLKALLRRLCALQGCTVVLVSGRAKENLESWFGALKISLVAEHGMWIREPGKEWIQTVQAAPEWKEHLVPLLEMYTNRLPGSFVETKDYSLAWHYRNADAELGVRRAKELTDDLVNYIANQDIQVLQGKKVIELRIKGATKGMAARHWIGRGTYDFILAAGDDETDEDLFTALPNHAYSFKIGKNPTAAKYLLASPKELRRIVLAMLS
ncbi:bifunctional alpha,alpha-trehalose-phosphate synthase (UDP-forming)/trehalose-phosphatase [Candidatus Uhrbacteria bacterium]|nr:bifunctional alpha,alpha-trehalose-phosphate synthase (UDP-forming)/trehalose-phosphatase [Candidatus Uhrbacteria bacterium]